MPKPVKFILPMIIAGLLVMSSWAGAVDRPNNKKVDNNDPVTKCQMACQDQKKNDSYEDCMLKCKKDHNKPTPVVPKK